MTNPTDQKDSLLGHLEELRSRLLFSLVFICVAFGVCWYFSSDLFDIIRKPISPYLPQSGGGLIFTGVMDKFIAHVKVAFLASIVISCPVWLYQIWGFIAPALYKHERRYGLFFIFFGSVLFLTGVGFVYYFVYPTCFEFLMNFGGDLDKPMITISDYVSFFILTTLMFGLVFELPLVLVILGVLGIIDAAFLRAKRRYAAVLLAAVSAIATPSPDVLSMVIMLIPLLALYEISILLIAVIGKRQRENSPAE